MIVHPTIIKDFMKQNKDDLHIKYVKTKKYQYLICKGLISNDIKNKIKKIFPNCYVTNGNKINQFNFRINPGGVND